MDRKILFVSDAHLDPAEPERTERLIAALEAELPFDRLVILGDLFEFWFGYRTVVFAGYLRLLAELDRLRRLGVALTYLAGNHDMVPGPIFTGQLGAEVHPGPTEIELGGRRVLLAHGDRINSRDYGYRLLCLLVRNRPAQALFRWVHPDLAWRIAMTTSGISRRHLAVKKECPEDVYLRFMEARRRAGYEIVIHGHSHRPGHRILELAAGRLEVLNPGDWLTSFTYGVWEGGQLALRGRAGTGR